MISLQNQPLTASQIATVENKKLSHGKKSDSGWGAEIGFPQDTGDKRPMPQSRENLTPLFSAVAKLNL
jgi:hypothetical protein